MVQQGDFPLYHMVGTGRNKNLTPPPSHGIIYVKGNMMRSIFIPIFAALAFFGLSAVALAGSPQCGSYPDVLELLTSQYGEAPVAMGFPGPRQAFPIGQIMELFANPETGTWTIVGYNPIVGVACMVGDGKGFESHEYEKPENYAPKTDGDAT